MRRILRILFNEISYGKIPSQRQQARYNSLNQARLVEMRIDLFLGTYVLIVNNDESGILVIQFE